MNRQEIIQLFWENLRAERARKKYSQEKLAEMADIMPKYLARIEKKKYSLSLVVIVNLAITLKVFLNKLIPLDKYIKTN